MEFKSTSTHPKVYLNLQLFIMNIGVVQASREQNFVEKSADCVKKLLLDNHSLSHSLYTVYKS